MILKSTMKTCSADPYRQPPDAAIPGRPRPRLLSLGDTRACCQILYGTYWYDGVLYITVTLLWWHSWRTRNSELHASPARRDVVVCIINLQDECHIPSYGGTTLRAVSQVLYSMIDHNCRRSTTPYHIPQLILFSRDARSSPSQSLGRTFRFVDVSANFIMIQQQSRVQISVQSGSLYLTSCHVCWRRTIRHAEPHKKPMFRARQTLSGLRTSIHVFKRHCQCFRGMSLRLACSSRILSTVP